MRVRSALDLGQVLKAARNRRGLSQVELAEVVGLHRNTVVQLEKGRGNPTWDVVLRLTEALGLQVDLAGSDSPEGTRDQSAEANLAASAVLTTLLASHVDESPNPSRVWSLLRNRLVHAEDSDNRHAALG